MCSHSLSVRACSVTSRQMLKRKYEYMRTYVHTHTHSHNEHTRQYCDSLPCSGIILTSAVCAVGGAAARKFRSSHCASMCSAWGSSTATSRYRHALTPPSCRVYASLAALVAPPVPDNTNPRKPPVHKAQHKSRTARALLAGASQPALSVYASQFVAHHAA